MKTLRGSLKTAVGVLYAAMPGETPTVNIKGQSGEAQEIVKIARRYGIPIVNNPSLAQALVELDVDSEIPPSLFNAVAIVLAHLTGNAKAAGKA